MSFSLLKKGKVRLKSGRFSSACFGEIRETDPIAIAQERKRRRGYTGHKSRATFHKIEFLLTYKEWLKIWLDSGHLSERGRKKGQYCMARNGDTGPHAIGNVRIVTTEENHEEHESRPEVKAARRELLKRKQGQYWIGRKHKESSKRKMRKTKKARKLARNKQENSCET